MSTWRDLHAMSRDRKCYVFSWDVRARASAGRVISESEHQKGRAIPLWELFKGSATHLFHKFLMRTFVILLSIFLYAITQLSFPYLDLYLFYALLQVLCYVFLYIMPWHIVFTKTRVLLRPNRDVLNSGIVSSASCSC